MGGIQGLLVADLRHAGGICVSSAEQLGVSRARASRRDIRLDRGLGGVALATQQQTGREEPVGRIFRMVTADGQRPVAPSRQAGSCFPAPADGALLPRPNSDDSWKVSPAVGSDSRDPPNYLRCEHGPLPHPPRAPARASQISDHPPASIHCSVPGMHHLHGKNLGTSPSPIASPAWIPSSWLSAAPARTRPEAILTVDSLFVAASGKLAINELCLHQHPLATPPRAQDHPSACLSARVPLRPGSQLVNSGASPAQPSRRLHPIGTSPVACPLISRLYQTSGTHPLQLSAFAVLRREGGIAGAEATEDEETSRSKWSSTQQDNSPFDAACFWKDTQDQRRERLAIAEPLSKALSRLGRPASC
jgi:hypothetical protein